MAGIDWAARSEGGGGQLAESPALPRLDRTEVSSRGRYSDRHPPLSARRRSPRAGRGAVSDCHADGESLVCSIGGENDLRRRSAPCALAQNALVNVPGHCIALAAPLS